MKRTVTVLTVLFLAVASMVAGSYKVYWNRQVTITVMEGRETVEAYVALMDENRDPRQPDGYGDGILVTEDKVYCVEKTYGKLPLPIGPTRVEYSRLFNIDSFDAIQGVIPSEIYEPCKSLKVKGDEQSRTLKDILG